MMALIAVSIVLASIAAWLTLGLYGARYWRRHGDRMWKEDLAQCFLATALGPVFLFGALIHCIGVQDDGKGFLVRFFEQKPKAERRKEKAKAMEQRIAELERELNIR